MTINEQVEYAAVLIKKHERLAREIEELYPYVEYLNIPVMDKRVYLKTCPSAARSTMRIISNLLAILTAGWFVYLIVRIATYKGIFLGFITSQDVWANELYSDREFIFISLIIGAAMLLVAAVFGTSSMIMRVSAYEAYLEYDGKYREICIAKAEEYNAKVKEYNNLEVSVNDPSVCVIPRNYWNKVDIILNIMRTGSASNLGEAFMIASAQ